MDKNKSRTDLLAAGKKRLQQFRQKKDNKGSSSHGKSSKKSGKTEKHESDADAASGASLSTASTQVTAGNVETDSDSNVVITDTLESQSLADLLNPDHNDPPVDLSSMAITYDKGIKTELDSSTKLALQVQGVCESGSQLSVQDEGEGVQDVGADVAKDVSLRTSDSLGFEGGATYDPMSAPVDNLSPPAPVTAAVGESVPDEREVEKREGSLLLSEDTPNTFLMQTREDQEADGLEMKKSCQSTDAETDGQKKLPLLEIGESDLSLSGIDLEETRIEEASHEAEQLGKLVEEIASDKFSASDKGLEDDIATAGPFLRSLEREAFPGSSSEETVLLSSQEQLSEGVLSGRDELNHQYAPAGSVVVDQIHDFSMGAHEVNMARQLGVTSVSDVSSVNLLQLAEIIKGLNEEEYHFLLKSRGAVSDADPSVSSSILPDHDFSEAVQRLKEELFLENLMKNIFSLLLAEQLELQLESDKQHDQLIDDLLQLQDSHIEVKEKNQHLTKELANCRVDLLDVFSKSVELQNQFNTSKAEVEALSARVVELQISFEMSQNEALDLSTELADCRGLISGLQAENKDVKETLALVMAEKNKLVEEKEFQLSESKKLVTDIADFKSSMEGVKVENSNLSERIILVTEERNKIKAEIEHLSHELDRLSIDLVENKDLVASLQAENSNLNGSLALSVDKIKKLEEDNQSFALGNQSHSSQIVALPEKLSVEKGERMRFEGDLKEAAMCLEQLTEENISLNINLDVHKAIIKEIGMKRSELLSQHRNLRNQAQVAWEQSEGLEIAITEDSLHMPQESDKGGVPSGSPVILCEQEVFDDSLGFVSLKTCLDEVEKVLVKLEKAINVLHSQSVSFGRSGEKVSSAVSKMVQAFESKTHQDENEVEGGNSIEVHSPSDSFIMLTKEQIGNLRTVLTQWRLDVQNAGALFKGERDGRKTGDAKYSELKDQFAALKQHCLNLEASNIELAVQYEAAKQLLGDIQEKKCHIEELCEALKQEDVHLKAKSNEVYRKLGNFQSKISELHTGIYDVKQSSNKMTSVIGSQLENLQKEVTERALLLEQFWNTIFAEIIEVVRKLDESVGETLPSTMSTDAHDGLDISHQLAVSVNVATEVILDLRKKLETTYAEHEIICTSYKEVNAKCDDLLGKNELAVGVLHKMYGDLRKLVLSHCVSMDEGKIDVQSEALPDLLNYNSYQTIMKYLGDILNEKLKLESVTKEMKSELMHRETELEELNMKCLGLDSISKLIEDVAAVLNVEDKETELNKAPISSLESLVSRLLQKTREVEIQLHMTKEGHGSKEMELAELKEKKHFLDTLCLEHENEILILKESLHQAEEALAAAHSELHDKTNELEHSEQRVSSIREKLSIAVAKGKGLVVQRDGLKQSLAETSIELERCLQELQLKEARLHEVETKLKTYAEAGERVEALESELSYIRNSANALRESFLLKDSMLQRIEEVLEDLDLPEQFHSRDVIEKIDWLARTVAGDSLPMNETSIELERCLQELQLKDARLHEVETKLKTYAEAGERVEALESELSYIRNSANALRESFLLKDSMLQRIEEVLEGLDLPEQFHSKDIIEKIDWLARTVAASSLPMNDWDQKDSASVGSYSDAAKIVMDSWKDDSHIQPDSGDDFIKKFEELQSKYYGLAEQNEMLEQSLMERNSLVQRWEELVGRIDMPSHLRSMETEDRIEWVGRALAEANHHIDSLQLKMEKYDSYCGLLNADLEESQRIGSALHADLRAVTSEREHLRERMEVLMYEYEKLSAQTKQAELENEKLHNEITSLKEKLEQKAALEEQIFIIDGKIRKLRDLVGDALAESETEYLDSGSESIDSLEELLTKLIENRATLSERMEVLMYEYEKLSAQTRQAELENEKLHYEMTSLKQKLEQKAAIEEQIFNIDGKIRKLQELVVDALAESETEYLDSSSRSIDSLEELLIKLIENHTTLSSTKPTYGDSLDGQHSQKDDATLREARSIDIHDTKEEPDIDSYKKNLEEALHELVLVKEERDRNLEKKISLSGEIEVLNKRTEELQELLNQEEQKSASVREKLNVAVKKGKSLVQQRDSLKRTIEEMNIEMDHLKSEINSQERTLAEHAQKFRELSTYPDRLEALESENFLLKNHLAETEHHLQEREYSLQVILNKLGEIEVGGEGNISDPVKKLEWVGKLCCDMHGAVASLEQESRKSKRASELLLAELNEVQERNDAFQEELAKVAAELVDLRKERDLAEAAKLEALSHIEKLSALHVELKNSHFSQIMGLKSNMNQLYKGFCEVGKFVDNAFFMDLESFQNLEVGLKSCMKGNNAANVVDSSVTREHDGILLRSSDNKKSSMSAGSWLEFDTIDHIDDSTIVELCRLLRHQLQEFLVEISSFKESIDMHSSLSQEHSKTLSKLMASIQREITSQRESCETMKKEISEQNGELVALRGNIAYLYEACINSVIGIENGKAELVGNKVSSSDLGINLKAALPFIGQESEEYIKTVADRLLLAAKEFSSIKTEFLDANQKEMKDTIANLQRDLQEKDVQRERICSELVNQIKDAEAAANSYSQDLQSFTIQEHNLKKQVEEIQAERKILEQRVNELQDRQGAAAELEEKIRSQTDLLTAKDQEIEALMHALDEEEMQMAESTEKIEELEKVVQQKNQEIENLESSRGKVMKKLSITVSKFDELHHLSASLLSEVEKLQSQLKERDAEISFLRQEITRCTNGVLLASQMSNKRSSDEIFAFLTWVDTMVSREGMDDMHPDVNSSSQVHEYKEILKKKLMSVLSELENLKAVAESKDAMLQAERSKVDELNHKAETLEMSLHEKELQLNLLEGVEETGRGASTSSEILEVEPVMNKRTAAGNFITPQVRSLRKGNNDHVAIAVDVDPGSTSRVDDEEDDKVHGFRSLTSSKIVPRFTRPMSDFIDGLWVSCDRALMRQPVLRLGIIIYWAIMHALLASFVV